ncbi:MAG: plasma-membrane proton-efflux P-type ATPase [Deltaproteobacteria bacterium]|nr:plasma-membrane proton-efflux P-type ATPase [Deltaproteobacteria bacterium]
MVSQSSHDSIGDAGGKDIEEVLQNLESNREGLSPEQAIERLDQYGPNTIEEKKENPLLKFLGYFWGPIPWMIEAAATLSVIVRHWTDSIIIFVMLCFNALVGYWQEHQAANALEALKEQLALKARVKRGGRWQEVSARELVPGDVIRIKGGDIVPADGKLFDGDYLSADESALTGESLPVEKESGDIVYSGSVAKKGEMNAVVVVTGEKTYFARTAKLVESAGAVSHFQKAVLTIGDYLIYMSLGLAGILVLTQLFRGDPFLTVFQFVLILVVAAIPVAMPAVLSVTMALGALALSHSKAIVTRLQSIEEIAGIDILCSDKTGTLTQNKLTLGDPIIVEAEKIDELVIAAALASKEEDQDAIDMAILAALRDKTALESYKQVEFVPFDPVSKRVEATVRRGEEVFKISKGAPQVIFKLCEMSSESRKRSQQVVDDLASKGFRTLAVARGSKEGRDWRLLGILPLYDPPREDSAETIKRAKDHGVDLKMVTGDNVAIAREISRQLGMKPNIQSAEQIFAGDVDLEKLSSETVTRIEQSDGFAEVFPEHKYGIVRALQERDHLVGMTGDGVNDAPALKQAEVGIAVSGATNAAQSAASLVLTAPGLSVIITAIEEARRIFERMNSYAVYRITETIRIMFFVVAAMVAFNFYPINTIMIILLALLNDLPIMTIAKDNTWLDPNPVRWDMRRVLTISTVLGLIGVIETFGLLLIGKLALDLTQAQLQSFIYLKLAVAGHLTLFVVRTKKRFYQAPHPSPVLFAAILGTQLAAAAIVGFGFLVEAIPWSYVGFIWVYCLIWMFIEDTAKLHLYRHLELSSRHHRSFLERIQASLHRP